MTDNHDRVDPTPEKRPLVDRMLKRLMPNHTVIRRYVMGSWLIKFMLVVVVIKVLGNSNENTAKIGQSVCAVITYTDDTWPVISDPAGKARLRRLGREMRETGIHCPPRTNSPLSP